MNPIIGITKKHKVIIILSILFCIGLISGLFLLYGPVPVFREWLITTAMTTMNHQYLATWFYSDENIAEVMDKHKVIEVAEITNPDLIKQPIVVELEGEKPVFYANEYEKQVLENPNNEDYKIIPITGDTYSGYLAVIYDPSRVKAVTTKNLGKSGQYLTKMAEENNALIAINGGGFYDPNYNSNGSTPLGVTIVNGQIKTDYQYTSSTGGVIGFTKDNKLVLGKMSAQKAINMGVRDAVSFGPFLIVNGKSSFIKGNGGWGQAPRTAIGQRQDGIVLFLVLDGRTISRPGADMRDLTEIMENYGAYNAFNLDGGASTTMVYDGVVVNSPSDILGERYVPNAFIITKAK